MTPEKEIEKLLRALEESQVRYYRTKDELDKDRAELNLIKRLARQNSKGWYVDLLQMSLSDIERQYAELQENFLKLSAKYSAEMEKRQYIFSQKPE